MWNYFSIPPHAISGHALKWLTRTGSCWPPACSEWQELRSCLSWWRTPVLAIWRLLHALPVYREGFPDCSGKKHSYTESSLFFSFRRLICALMFLFPSPRADFCFPVYLVKILFNVMFNNGVFLYFIILLISCLTVWLSKFQCCHQSLLIGYRKGSIFLFFNFQSYLQRQIVLIVDNLEDIDKQKEEEKSRSLTHRSHL